MIVVYAEDVVLLIGILPITITATLLAIFRYRAKANPILRRTLMIIIGVVVFLIVYVVLTAFATRILVGVGNFYRTLEPISPDSLTELWLRVILPIHPECITGVKGCAQDLSRHETEAGQYIIWIGIASIINSLFNIGIFWGFTNHPTKETTENHQD